MTKKQESMKWSYDNAKAKTLWEAYERPSSAKVRAYDSCLADVSAHNGYGQRITGASSHFFSFAFLYDDQAGKHLRYHTHANVYDFIIEAAAELLETAAQ